MPDLAEHFREWSDNDLMMGLRYQTRGPEHTTIGPCRREAACVGNGVSRGGATCAACVRAEIERRKGASDGA